VRGWYVYQLDDIQEQNNLDSTKAFGTIEGFIEQFILIQVATDGHANREDGSGIEALCHWVHFIAGLCSIDDDREPTLEFDHFTLPILLNQSSRYLPTRTLTGGGIYRCICRSVK